VRSGVKLHSVVFIQHTEMERFQMEGQVIKGFGRGSRDLGTPTGII